MYAEPSSIDHFVIRSLRPDCLPSQCLWTTDSPAASSPLLGIGSIGSRGGGGGGAGGGSTNTHPSRTSLKKLNLVGEKKIVIEMLDDRQQKVRPQASGAFRVWAQRLDNPENSIEVKTLSSITYCRGHYNTSEM